MANIRDTIYSDSVSNEDKIEVFTQNIPELAKLQREFAFMCASRVVEGCDVQEIKDYFTLILFIYESGELGLLDSEEYWSADWAAYWAANRAADMAAGWGKGWAANSAAYSAAYRAPYWAAYKAKYWVAEREVQVEMVKYLLDREGEG